VGQSVVVRFRRFNVWFALELIVGFAMFMVSLLVVSVRAQMLELLVVFVSFVQSKKGSLYV
jgi:hypothetical protein